jgi:hypothetical protein
MQHLTECTTFSHHVLDTIQQFWEEDEEAEAEEIRAQAAAGAEGVVGGDLVSGETAGIGLVITTPSIIAPSPHPSTATSTTKAAAAAAAADANSAAALAPKARTIKISRIRDALMFADPDNSRSGVNRLLARGCFTSVEDTLLMEGRGADIPLDQFKGALKNMLLKKSAPGSGVDSKRGKIQF